MTSLYKLSGALRELQEMIEEGQEINLDNIEAIEGAIEDKLEGYGKLLRNLESDEQGLRNEEKRIADKRRALSNNISRIKKHVEETMIFTNKRKVKASLFTFNIQNNPPSVFISDSSMLPSGYLVEQEPAVNKKEILQDLKLGLEVPGAEIQQTESLRIR